MYADDSLAASQVAARSGWPRQADVPIGELRAVASTATPATPPSPTSSASRRASTRWSSARTQIVAQLKSAYQTACEGGCTSVVFNRLFRRALEVGKRVRTETAIGERPVSVSSAAVELALQVFGKFKDHTVLILGAGETSELTATHLKAPRHRAHPGDEPDVRRRGGAGRSASAAAPCPSRTSKGTCRPPTS